MATSPDKPQDEPRTSPQADPAAQAGPKPDDTPPWDARMKGETTLNFARFAAFRDLGPSRKTTSKETDQAVAQANGGKVVDNRSLRRIMAKHRWQDRAAAYDVWLDRQRVEANVKATLMQDVEDYREQQARLGKVMVEGMVRLVTIGNRALADLQTKQAEGGGTTIAFRDAVRAYEVAARVAPAAASAQAQAIGLKELVAVLQEQQENAGWTKLGDESGTAPRAEA